MAVTILLILSILICILLVVVILGQDSKGGAFAGFSGASQLMGARQTTNVLEKLTWGFLAAIIVLVVSTSFMLKSSYQETNENSLINEAKKAAPAAAPAASPLQGAGDSGAAPIEAAPAEGAATPAGEAVPVTPAPAGEAAPAATPAEPAK